MRGTLKKRATIEGAVAIGKNAVKPITSPPASRQVAFHQLLVAARKSWLMDALSDALRRIDPDQLKKEIAAYVPKEAQQILAAAGVRDEHVFPMPTVLKEAPTLIGYYRLLLGAPQKSFYTSGTGMGQFRSMETRGSINALQEANLEHFCRAMSGGLADLVCQMSPRITPRDVAELPLLTIGAQFQGGNNNTIGRRATESVLLSIKGIVKKHIIKEEAGRLIIQNSAGRNVTIIVGGDPDVRIQEEIGGGSQKKVAIEVKGGTDKSNAHNRAGEAEKSHQKAKNQGFRDFWTIIAKMGLDLDKLKMESPTTNTWFDATQILGRDGSDWEEFRTRIAGEVGIPVS